MYIFQSVVQQYSQVNYNGSHASAQNIILIWLSSNDQTSGSITSWNKFDLHSFFYTCPQHVLEMIPYVSTTNSEEIESEVLIQFLLGSWASDGYYLGGTQSKYFISTDGYQV